MTSPQGALARSPFAWIGAPSNQPDLGAWTKYLTEMRSNIKSSWAEAVVAYRTLKTVREMLGLPFLDDSAGEGGAASSHGAWTTDLETQAQDIHAMVTLIINSIDDVLAGKRKLQGDQTTGELGIELLSTDLIRIEQQSPSGVPVIIDVATGQPTHVTGQVEGVGDIPGIVWFATATTSVLVLPVYWVVDSAVKTITDVGEQKTMQTIAQRQFDCVQSGKCTPAEAAALGKAVYEGAKGLHEAKAQEKAAAGVPSSEWAKTAKTLGWVALGIAGIYLVAKVIPSGGISLGRSRRAALPAKLNENPRKRTRLQELQDMLPPEITVRTWSPGDGVTRYRFFRNAPANQSYYGPDNGIYTALGYKEAYTFAQGMVRDNPRKPVDEEAAHELVLYVENTDRFAIGGHGIGRSVSQNLWKKWKKGTYDPEKAPKIWDRLLEEAAKAYAREYSYPASSWKEIFVPSTRALAASELTDIWESHAKSGEFDRYPP